MNGTLLDRADLPKGFAHVDELEAFMARPSRELVDDLATVSGDILVLELTLSGIKDFCQETPRDRSTEKSASFPRLSTEDNATRAFICYKF